MAALYLDQRSGTAAIFGPQYGTLAPAPTGVITSIVVSGQDVTISGTTANTPTSALATLPAAGTPNGAVSQGPSTVTLGSGTFTITFVGVPPGSYAIPVVTLTNGTGSAAATGGSTVEILGFDGEPEAPGPIAFTPDGVTLATTLGTVTWAYTAPEPVNYTFAPDGLTLQMQVGSVTWSYTPPVPDDYTFAPDGLDLSMELGAATWGYTPPTPQGNGLVTMQQARAHLRSDETDDDADLQLKIMGASAAVVDYLGSYAADFAEETGEVKSGKTVPSRVQMATLLTVAYLYRERDGSQEHAVPSQFGYGYSLPQGATALLYSLRKPVLA